MTEAGDFSKTGIKVSCPKDCIALTNDTGLIVLGPSEATDDKSARIYTLNSSICGSAIHAGIIINEQGGDVLLHLTKGREN